jgi:hypothetical protein
MLQQRGLIRNSSEPNLTSAQRINASITRTESAKSSEPGRILFSKNIRRNSNSKQPEEDGNTFSTEKKQKSTNTKNKRLPFSFSSDFKVESSQDTKPSPIGDVRGFQLKEIYPDLNPIKPPKISSARLFQQRHVSFEGENTSGDQTTRKRNQFDLAHNRSQSQTIQFDLHENPEVESNQVTSYDEVNDYSQVDLQKADVVSLDWETEIIDKGFTSNQLSNRDELSKNPLTFSGNSTPDNSINLKTDQSKNGNEDIISETDNLAQEVAKLIIQIQTRRAKCLLSPVPMPNTIDQESVTSCSPDTVEFRKLEHRFASELQSPRLQLDPTSITKVIITEAEIQPANSSPGRSLMCSNENNTKLSLDFEGDANLGISII